MQTETITLHNVSCADPQPQPMMSDEVLIFWILMIFHVLVSFFPDIFRYGRKWRVLREEGPLHIGD